MTMRSILIVDDEANQRFMLEQALSMPGHDWSITTAASAREALALVGSWTPDLIITDYHMPAMNGIDLIASLRARAIGSRIVLITAYSSADLYEAAQQLQVDHYLTKPVPLALLRRLTMAILEDSSVPSERQR